MDYLKSQGADPDDIIDEHDNIFDVVQAKFNKLNSSNKISSNSLENSGRGSFRAVFSCDKDYVIKIDASIDGSGIEMNREDQQLGTNKKYGDIFPRVFMFDPRYKWIVAEKVREVDTPEEINKFFPNVLLRSDLMNTHMYLVATAGAVAVVTTAATIASTTVLNALKNAAEPIIKEATKNKFKIKIKQVKPVLHYVLAEGGHVDVFEYSAEGTRLIEQVTNVEQYIRDQVEINALYEIDNKIIIDDVIKDKFTKEGKERFKPLFAPAKKIAKKLSARLSF